ncbi:MAG: flagellar basal body rod protein FlgB [Spirochaetota bacterium]|nr:flagellar basal body rod protein FlgB [Spirochaetota bacterium]
MFLETSLMKTQDLLNRAMTAESMRWSVINNNIANADTPNFKRSEVVFESELQRALKNENHYQIEAKRTNPMHIPFNKPKNYQMVTPKVRLEFDSSYRNDKNNIDIDKEMVDAAKTTLRYNAFASMMGRNFKKISILLR